MYYNIDHKYGARRAAVANGITVYCDKISSDIALHMSNTFLSSNIVTLRCTCNMR